MRGDYEREGWLLNRPWLRFDSVLANRLQSTGARRLTVMLVLLASIAAGAFVAWGAWSEIAEPGDGSYWIFPRQFGFAGMALLILYSLLAWPVIQRLLFLSVRSTLRLPGAPFDERQQLVAMGAEVAARRLTLLAMGAAGAVGAIVILIGTRTSTLNLVPAYAGLFATLFVCAANSHLMVLAWTLRDDDPEDAEGAI